MDTSQHQKKREKVADKEAEDKSKQQGQPTEQQSPTTTTTSSPPSASSSPSHEFSFTISLHPSSTPPDKTNSTPSLAIDLSPADDIFFHGHLLPLHLPSHLPISPRSSSNSLDSFSLPIKDLLEEQKPNCNNNHNSNSNSNHSNTSGTTGRIKPKTFALFRLAKWRKRSKIGNGEDEEKEKKRRMRFDVSHIIRRYVRMVRPLLLFRGGRKENRQLHKQPYSFSGNLIMRGKQDWRGRKEGQFSAPTSIRTSPTNSGPLLGTETLPSSTHDSTMEELQSAIQAAIAHCKNSIAMKEEKLTVEI